MASCITLREIPKAYPISRNTSKNKLLPLAVLDMRDLRMEIGHESPKQSIVTASINSVMKEISNFNPPMLTSCFSAIIMQNMICEKCISDIYNMLI